ncbi:hypothetical protein AAEQ75_16405 [Pseudomonas sediminis]
MQRLAGIARATTGGDVRHPADTDHQLAAAVLETFAGIATHPGQHITGQRGVVPYLLHVMLIAQIVQLSRRPFAVAVELLARQVPVLTDVVVVQAALLLAVVEVAETTGGIGHRDQIGEEGIL